MIYTHSGTNISVSEDNKRNIAVINADEVKMRYFFNNRISIITPSTVFFFNPFLDTWENAEE